MTLISVIHGPNLNLLGTREPDIYGDQTLDDINSALRRKADELGLDIEFFQSNHEGRLVDHIQSCRGRTQGIIINAAACAVAPSFETARRTNQPYGPFKCRRAGRHLAQGSFRTDDKAPQALRLVVRLHLVNLQTRLKGPST